MSVTRRSLTWCVWDAGLGGARTTCFIPSELSVQSGCSYGDSQQAASERAIMEFRSGRWRGWVMGKVQSVSPGINHVFYFLSDALASGGLLTVEEGPIQAWPIPRDNKRLGCE